MEQQNLTHLDQLLSMLEQGQFVEGMEAFYEATMEFKTKDGQHVVQNQAVVTTWKNGKIVDERYYHANV